MQSVTPADVATAGIHIMPAADLAEFRRVIHPDAVNRESAHEPPATRGRGPAAFHATALWLRAAFSDLSFAVHHTVTEGDLVVQHVTLSGVHTGTFVTYDEQARVARAFPATGRPFAVTQTHWQRIRDGQVVEHWANRDDQGLALQADWVPPTPLYLIRCARATARARRAAGRIAPAAGRQ
jgi:predicted ester cyclase